MNGLLIIDKPEKFTSHDVVARVRRILNERRVGHTGTLDPFATGVLVLLVGRVTRLAQFLSGADKEYDAVIRFGYATETGDLTGKRLPTTEQPAETVPFLKNAEELEHAMSGLRGEIEQIPPMYSAKKINGRRLYEAARRGEEISRQFVPVNVREFAVRDNGGPLLSYNDDGTCDLEVRIVCSAGTYIRTLAEALGERVGVAAHVCKLRRTRAGQFRIEDAVTLDSLKELAGSSPSKIPLVSADTALSEMPCMHLTVENMQRVRNGMAVSVEPEISAPWSAGEHVRLTGMDGELSAVGAYDDIDKVVRPKVVLAKADMPASR